MDFIRLKHQQKKRIMKRIALPSRIYWIAGCFLLLIGTASFKLMNSMNTSKESGQEEEFLSEEGEMLIHETLILPLYEKLEIDPDVMMFSRCPSGLQNYIIETPTKE